MGGIPLRAALVPLGTHGKLWDAATAGATFVQESHLPPSADRGPDASNPKDFQLWLLTCRARAGTGGRAC